MSLPTLLLVDLRKNKVEDSACADSSDLYKVYPFDDIEGINEILEDTRIDCICFEFDVPDDGRLITLEKTRSLYPEIPILMITEHHDENLAIWALRARVWDYLVKPINCEDIFRSINILTDPPSSSFRHRVNATSENTWSDDGDVRRPNTIPLGTSNDTTFKVIRYIENHYHEKIYIAELAEQCCISQYQFSRMFKREKGITFREYLVQFRLNKACDLLKDSSLPVGDVGYSVGFSDHSYFTRMFRRHVGVSPSDYRLQHR